MKPSTERMCKQEWLSISDGSKGRMAGCGSISFKNTPRSATAGNDLYVTFKGAPSTSCMAYCNEDITKDWPKPEFNPVKPLKSKPLVNGRANAIDAASCGKRKNQGRVVKWETAMKFEFPWMAGIIFKDQNKTRIPECGASIINNRYVVSAAHCFAFGNVTVKPEEIQVLLHAHVMDKEIDAADDDPRFSRIPGWKLPLETDETEGSLRYEVETITNHPLFTDATDDWDLSLLRLKTKLDFGDKKIFPVCIPKIGENLGLKQGDMLTVSGWGFPYENASSGARVLEKLDVPVVGLNICKKQEPDTKLICAGYPEGGKDACQGDSGRPLIKKLSGPNQYILAGVVSAGEGCAQPGHAGLYTNLEEYVQWVSHHTEDGIYCGRS